MKGILGKLKLSNKSHVGYDRLNVILFQNYSDILWEKKSSDQEKLLKFDA